MIKLAIAGMGRWGQTLVESVQGKSGRVKFTHVVSRSPVQVQPRADRFGLAILADLDSALAARDIDGVVLATPHSLHADQVVACAQAGKPVFVEKPFTLTVADAERALVAVSAAGTVCAAGHNRRFLPATAVLANSIEAGRLGKITFVECNYSGNVAGRYHEGMWRVAPSESPAGGLAGAGIHLIDLIVHLLGPVAKVTAISSRQVLDVPIDDTTAALLMLRMGTRASLVMLMASAPDFRLKFFGTRGNVELPDPNTLRFTSLDGETESRSFDPVDTERAELEAFASAISGVSTFPVSHEEILWGIAAFEGICRSVNERRPVALEQ